MGYWKKFIQEIFSVEISKFSLRHIFKELQAKFIVSLIENLEIKKDVEI
jgi:hypothetical protein